MTVQSAQLSQLHGADGSATYSSDGYTILCAVNGPIEVQRRDEIPDEAAIEVNLRPVSGVGSQCTPHPHLFYIPLFQSIIPDFNPQVQKNAI